MKFNTELIKKSKGNVEIGNVDVDLKKIENINNVSQVLTDIVINKITNKEG